MALADIRKKIEGEAAAKAESILAEAQRQADELSRQAEDEIAAVAARYDKSLADETPEIKRRATIVANLDVARLMLGAKRELMDRALDGSLDVLASIDEKQYGSFMEKLLDKAAVTGEEELLVGPEEKVLNAAWLDKYNAARGKKITMSSEHPAIRGGFILRRGKISENCSFETLVRWLRDDLESDLTARLFADE